MTGNLGFAQLKEEVAAGKIDTVVAAFTDMQGRLMGKRFHAQFFVDGAYEETHACNYLLADDIDMEPVPGYKAASWEKGYGDFVLKPDLDTMCRTPWLPGTALVLCDVLDHHTHDDVPHSPRAILKKQLKRLSERKMKAYMASELEFFLFDDSYETANEKGYRGLKTAGPYIEDYHILQTTKEEGVMRAIRNGLQGAGIPVENSKGEWGPGQEEINVRYAEALEMADRHVVLKNACKEIAWASGQGHHLHGEVGLRACRQLLPHPPVAVVGGRIAVAVPRCEGRARHVGDHEAVPGGPARPCRRDHLFPGALHQLLQALHGGNLRADAGRLELRQPHGGIPPVRGGQQGASASNAGWAAPTSIPISPSRRCSPRASTASRRR